MGSCRVSDTVVRGIAPIRVTSLLRPLFLRPPGPRRQRAEALAGGVYVSVRVYDLCVCLPERVCVCVEVRVWVWACVSVFLRVRRSVCEGMRACVSARVCVSKRCVERRRTSERGAIFEG